MRVLLLAGLILATALRPMPSAARDATPAYADVVGADQPLLYWRLSSPSVDDASGNGQAGQPSGGVSFGQPGAIANDPDSAASFDGQSGAIGTASSIAVGSDFSLEVWTKAASRGQSAAVVSLDAGPSASRTLYLDDNHFEGRVDQSANWPNYTISSGSLDPTVWHHVVFTVSGWTTLSLYVDGVLAANGSVPSTAAFSASPVVGWTSATWLGHFGGSLDEVALYGYALPAPRVQAHFQAGRGSACALSLQAQIDAAAPGSTLAVAPCIYRETVTISKPLVLDGQGQAEIRGSDVWSSWSTNGHLWWAGPLPNLPVVADTGRCAEPSDRCVVPYQVFVDGKPLPWTPPDPSPGFFSVDRNNWLVLADNPSGHVIEVTTRQRWAITAADGVTIQGFTMKHAGNDAQSGAISNDRHANWTLQHNTLSDAHGDVVSVDYGSGTRVLANDIARGGDLGLHGDHPSNLLVQGNTIHNNSTDGFAGDWEAGNVKMGAASGLTLDGNEIAASQTGPGVWCDVDCSGVVYSHNRVHHNAGPGLFFEISNGAKIVGNVLWENAWSNQGWGNAAIGISSSANADVSGNTLAWNAAGIAVIAQNRPDMNPAGVVGNTVHDNIIIGTAGTLALAWLSDSSQAMFDPSSGNHGTNNRYWFPDKENGTPRFVWSSNRGHLEDFNATPGEHHGQYLATADRDSALQSAGLPTTRQSS